MVAVKMLLSNRCQQLPATRPLATFNPPTHKLTMDTRAVAPLLPTLYWELKTVWRLEEYRWHYVHLITTMADPEAICAAATAINLLSLNLRTLRGTRRRPAAITLCPSCMRTQSTPLQACTLCTSLHVGELLVNRIVQLE